MQKRYYILDPIKVAECALLGGGNGPDGVGLLQERVSEEWKNKIIKSLNWLINKYYLLVSKIYKSL